MIDWLAVSVDLFAVLESRGDLDDLNAISADLDGSVGACSDAVAVTVKERFFGDLFDLGERGRGRFYAWRYALRNSAGDHVGLVEFGGCNTLRKDGTRTCRVELTGTGCRDYETSNGDDHAQRWLSLASLLGCCGARITRVDIAADDFAGAYPVSWAMDRYNDGGFDYRGQRPKARLIDDMGNRTGKTFYVGSRLSDNQLRVYEKGREQGDKDSEWVRYEAQLNGSTRRDLPLEVLTNPAPYLVGAYPVLSFVEAIGERLRIATEELVATCKRAVASFRQQYGPMLNAMLHASGGDEATLARLVVGVARSKLPAWCPRPDDASQLLGAILFAPVGHIEGSDRAEPEEHEK